MIWYLLVMIIVIVNFVYGEIQLLPYEGASIEVREVHYKDKEGQEPITVSSTYYGQHEIDIERASNLEQIEDLQSKDIPAEIAVVQEKISDLDKIQVELDKLGEE